MQTLLSLEQAPPISAPLRFFLTAPLFVVLAACLMLASGPAVWASRWTPAALAATHLMTAGFMLQVMLGALQQLLPVIAGAHITHARRVAAAVHLCLSLGVICLALAFLSSQPLWFGGAAALLTLGVGVFVVAAGRALAGIATSSPTVAGIKLALVGLVVTVALGGLLAVALGGSMELPISLVRLVNVHLGWGWVGWGAALLGAVALMVVPMFQMTPAYPLWFSGGFAKATLLAVALWSLAEGAGWNGLAGVAAAGVALAVSSLACTTLYLQTRSKRPAVDAVGRLWQVSMLCALAACALWVAGRLVPAVGQWSGWPLLMGVLVLFGAFMSVMVAMLYKIVPFLVWLHLQELGQGRVQAPNIKKILPQRHIDRQTRSHWVALSLLLLATVWPQWFAYPAGAALLLASLWLMCNLAMAAQVYRVHAKQLKTQGPPAADSRHR